MKLIKETKRNDRLNPEKRLNDYNTLAGEKKKNRGSRQLLEVYVQQRFEPFLQNSRPNKK